MCSIQKIVCPPRSQCAPPRDLCAPPDIHVLNQRSVISSPEIKSVCSTRYPCSQPEISDFSPRNPCAPHRNLCAPPEINMLHQRSVCKIHVLHPEISVLHQRSMCSSRNPCATPDPCAPSRYLYAPPDMCVLHQRSLCSTKNLSALFFLKSFIKFIKHTYLEKEFLLLLLYAIKINLLQYLLKFSIFNLIICFKTYLMSG